MLRQLQGVRERGPSSVDPLLAKIRLWVNSVANSWIVDEEECFVIDEFNATLTDLLGGCCGADRLGFLIEAAHDQKRFPRI